MGWKIGCIGAFVSSLRYLVARMIKLRGIFGGGLLLHVLTKMLGVPAWSLSVSLNEFNDGSRSWNFLSLQISGGSRVDTGLLI